MKKNLVTVFLLLGFFVSRAQGTEEATVKQVLDAYKRAIQKLDTTGVSSLFVPGSKVYEGGSDEGTIQNYLGHHLAPELKEFKSFTFSDYKANVEVAGNYAFATETYLYTIVLAKDAKEIRSKGVATSVLKKTDAGWKIAMTHSSFRRAK